MTTVRPIPSLTVEAGQPGLPSAVLSLSRPLLNHASRLDRVRAEQARTLFRNCPIGVIGSGCAAVVLAIAFARSGRAAPELALRWSVMMIGCVLMHLALCVAYWRTRPAVANWRRWLWLFTAVAALEGVTWAFGAVWMTSPHDLTQELVVILVSSVMASGAVPVFGAYQPTYFVFFFPTIVPHLCFSLVRNYPLHDSLAVLIAVYLIAMTLIARYSNSQFVEGLELRFQNLDLVADLQQQKAIAVQANRDKSSFLAAASHDLRQPIHALGLFIGALRGRRMDIGSRALVDQISGSVEAMDGLFAALLDISKLDAGVVEPQFEPVAVGLLLDRLALDHAGEAAAKGLRLRVVRSSAVVHSDPALLERIIRNILANAVRYTMRGSIVAGCRRRGGAVSIEVWDSGCGITAREQNNIFKEFYQVDNPERDRNKGLGLGLAIVQRTAALLGATLTVVSEPASGSGFRLLVPRSSQAAALPLRADTTIAAMRTGLIFVVDDEGAIQQATASLLSSWGHRVVVGAAARDILAQHAGRPDLIICDYRLRDGETGITAIRQLQQAFEADIPAILITGDTAPDRILEAQAGGHLLLHKPLSNRKLRAAIGNVLRRADAARAA